MTKVVVLGIDGCSFDLVNEWIKSNDLPNFKHIKINGVSGSLRSTTPPFSAPAWTSIITGCNPGKHGIYGFESIESLDTHLINSRYRKASAFWNYLSDIGYSSIAVNIPGTYPPERINGTMITGLLTPSRDVNFTYPSDLKNRLNSNDLGDYELESIWLDDFPRSYTARRSPEKLLNQLIKQIDSRANVTLNLMKEADWDFCMVVLRGTDTMQHFLIHRKDLLLRCYKRVDEIIGSFLKDFPDTVFFLVSDHGFEQFKKVIYPANVLFNYGYLTPSVQPDYHNLNYILQVLIYRFVKLLLEILPMKVVKSSFFKKMLFTSSSKNKIFNFSKTKAFCTAEGRGILINLQKRFKEGIVDPKDYTFLCDELIKLFNGLVDPDTGDKVIDIVFKGPDVYGKDALNFLDLILKPIKGVSVSEGFRTPDSLIKLMESKGEKIPWIYKEDSTGITGNHADYGVLFAYGNCFKQGVELKNASVMDVLPMVFTALELPVPDFVDGVVHENVFSKKPVVKYANWDELSGSKKVLYSSETLKINKLKNQLKGLKPEKS